MIDEFTRASPTYVSAMRHPHKSGVALEVVSAGIRIAPGFIVFALVCIGCAVAWAVTA